MYRSSLSTRSFVFDIDDGIITPVESEPQTPDMKLDQTSLDTESLSSGTLQGMPWHENEKVTSLFEDSGVVFPPSNRRLGRSSRPPPLAPFPSTALPTSSWFDDTPTQSMFSFETEESTAEWDMQSEWLDDPKSPIYGSFSQRESDRMSTFTFGRGGATSPDQSSDSHGSSTMVPTEIDSESIKSSKSQPLDSLDEQLLTSPIDSFAALCWTSTISERRRSSVSVPELRLSRLYSDAALDYEEYHWQEYSEEKGEKLPGMQFSADFIPRHVPEEVAPWMYLPEKAVSVLDLPSDARTSQTSSTASLGFRRKHRRGQTSLGTIAGKCRRAIGCMNGVNGRS